MLLRNLSHVSRIDAALPNTTDAFPPGEHADQPAAFAAIQPIAAPSSALSKDRRSTSRLPLTLRGRRELRAILTRQRLLSDRSGRSFCVVTFAAPSRDKAEALARVLLVRKRETDEIGRAPLECCRDLEVGAAKCLVAVLPETEVEGAARFAAEVVARLPMADRPHYRVSHYPISNGGHRSFDRRRDASGPISRPAFDGADSVHNARTLFARRLPLWKRTVDVIVAGGGLIVLGPLMALIAIAIRIDSRGPALFWQARRGLANRAFRIAKFRTMVVDAERLKGEMNLRSVSEQDGPAFKLRRDPRVTRVGALLRVTSLDELPQLWNVLRGEMTLVGPRPLPVDESDACLAWQHRRLDVTPGLTCIWQVHGRSRVQFDDWMRMDLKYVRRSRGWFGILHDATLLLKTLPAVFLKRGF